MNLCELFRSQMQPVSRSTAMNIRWKHIIGLFAIVATVACGGSAQGDWSNNFESPLPASFAINQIGPPSGTFSAGIDNGQLRFRDPQINVHGPGFGGVGRETSQIFDDARMSGILNAAGNSNDYLGLNIRNQALGTSTYGARIEFNIGRLAVFKVVNFVPVLGILSDSPGQGSQPLLSDLARSYFVQFDVVGNVLDARAYDQPGGSELLHVHYVDDQGIGGPPLPPGYAGVSAIREEGSLDGAFDNLTVTSIPEPGTCVLAVVGLTVLVSFRRCSLLNWSSS
jgi:hypothetical protein